MMIRFISLNVYLETIKISNLINNVLLQIQHYREQAPKQIEEEKLNGSSHNE